MNANEWNTVTARHRQAQTQDPMVNRYQGLADDATNVPGDHTIASANSVVSEISEARYRQYHSKSVQDYIAKSDLKPMVGNVTSLDVDNFQEIVAQALSKIKSRYT